MVTRGRAVVQLPQHQRDLPVAPGRRRRRVPYQVRLRGVDIGEYHQPGSNGLAFDPQGRLTICQHGNRRVVRIEPRGNITVLADSLRRAAAQQPQRPRLPLGRHAVLHRPALRAPAGLRRSPQGASVLRRLPGAQRRGRAVHRRAAQPQGHRASRPTNASCTSATGVSTTRLSCAGISTPRARSRTATAFFDMTGAARRGRHRRHLGRSRRQPVRCGPGGIWVLAGRRTPPWHDPSAREPRTTWPGATTTAARSTSPRSPASTGSASFKGGGPP